MANHLIVTPNCGTMPGSTYRLQPGVYQLSAPVVCWTRSHPDAKKALSRLLNQAAPRTLIYSPSTKVVFPSGTVIEVRRYWHRVTVHQYENCGAIDIVPHRETLEEIDENSRYWALDAVPSEEELING